MGTTRSAARRTGTTWRRSGGSGLATTGRTTPRSWPRLSDRLPHLFLASWKCIRRTRVGRRRPLDVFFEYSQRRKSLRLSKEDKLVAFLYDYVLNARVISWGSQSHKLFSLIRSPQLSSNGGSAAIFCSQRFGGASQRLLAEPRRPCSKFRTPSLRDAVYPWTDLATIG